jgi:nucleolar pre-ribosomal-associated protein 1
MASTFEVQHVPCVLSLINKGLMHADDLVKHGSLRLVSEPLNLLQYVTEAISGMVSTIKCEIDIGIH